jgi:hypothetical protein
MPQGSRCQDARSGWRRGGMMKRIVLAAAIASLPWILPTAAWARGDGWELVELPGNGHLLEHCGSMPVDVTWPVNKEYQRTVLRPNGTIVTQFTGHLVVRFAAPSGVARTFNISGPGKIIDYMNGELEVEFNGLSGGPPLVSGMPDLVWTAGRAHIIYHADGTVTVIRLPHRVVDVCEALGL